MSRVCIPVTEIEFEEGGNTLWIHGPHGSTVLRLKTFNGTITSMRCSTSTLPHGDGAIEGDLVVCLPKKAKHDAEPH